MSLWGKYIKLRGTVYFLALFSVAIRFNRITIFIDFSFPLEPGELPGQFSFQVNDGVVNIHSVLWSEGDELESSHNFYMNDTDEDGGYNHFELRNYDRAYTLVEDGGVVFRKGDPSPAMEEVKSWISDDIRSFN